MGRYTHDLSNTTEVGGLFFTTPVPNVATTLTDVPGQVFVGQLTTTIGSNLLNEASVQFSSNAISSDYGDNARSLRTDYGLTIPEVFSENRNALMPTINVTGALSFIGAPQLFDNDYKNLTFTDNLSWAREQHTYKMGVLFAFEQKNEISGSATQGSFTFAAAGGFSAFQNFLRGNRDGACGASCTYTEPEREVDAQVRVQRYEFYAQDTWRLRPNVTFDYGLRYALYPSVTDANDVLTNFDPALYRSRARPPADGRRPGDGRNRRSAERHCRRWSELAIRQRNQRDGQEQPAASHRHDLGRVLRYPDHPARRLRHLLRPAADGHLPSECLHEPAVRVDAAAAERAAVEPGRGDVADDPGCAEPDRHRRSVRPPRIQQWNVGVQRELYRRGVIDVGYVGSAGDNLIQPVDINQPQPQDVVRTGVVNTAAAVSRVRLGQRSSNHGAVALQRDARELPPRPGARRPAERRLHAQPQPRPTRPTIGMRSTCRRTRSISKPNTPIARTDRTHVLTFNYVYELPFFRERITGAESGARRLAGGGHHPDVVGPANLACRQRDDQWLTARNPREPNQRPVHQLAGGPSRWRLLVQSGGVCVAAAMVPTATPAARFSASLACISGTSRCRRTSMPRKAYGSSSAPISSMRSTNAVRSGGDSERVYSWRGLDLHDGGTLRPDHADAGAARNSAGIPSELAVKSFQGSRFQGSKVPRFNRSNGS